MRDLTVFQGPGPGCIENERIIDISFVPLLGLIDPVDLAGIAWVIVDDVYGRKAILFPL